MRDLTNNNKKIEIQIKRPMIQLISNIVYEQRPSFVSPNTVLKMDVLKHMSDGKKPAVVFITGGGFISANKDNYIQQRIDLAEAGYVVASIEYSVIPEAIFPQPLLDVKSAIRFLKVHAGEFSIDSGKIGVMGDSAGGYLAALAGTTCGVDKFELSTGFEHDSSIKAVVNIYGLSDLTKIAADFSNEVQELHKSAGAPEALWINGIPGFGGKDGGILADKEKAEAANPITYISQHTPPFLLMHGNNDKLVSLSQTELLHQALVQNGIESSRYIVEGAEHGGVYWNQDEIMQIIIEFFDQHLK